MRQSPFIPIPEDTRHVAHRIYSPSQPYMIIGNQDRSLVIGIDFSGSGAAWGESEDFLNLLSLVTVFQYAEHLSDRQAAQATSERVDWKYALHLPMTYPGIAPSFLCTFRQGVAAHPLAYSQYQVLINKLATLKLFTSCKDDEPRASEVITVNCLRNRLDRCIHALLPAIETLAVEEPAWLCQVALPHWLTRYSPKNEGLFDADTEQDLVEMTKSLMKDINYLTDCIDAQLGSKIKSISEIQLLFDVRLETDNSRSVPDRRPLGNRWLRFTCSSCSIFPASNSLSM